VQQSRTGSWIADKQHPLHESLQYVAGEQVNVYLCTWNNRYAIFTDSTGTRKDSSILIMYTKDWLYTKSGSLYKIQW